LTTAIVVDVGLFKRRSKDLFTVPEAGRAAPEIEPAVSFGFRMAVADVFVIAGRGTVVTGTIEAGMVAVGARVTIERAGRPALTAEVAGVERARKMTKQASAGDRVGLLFRGLARVEIAVGDMVRTL
jgi:translation elongation factor EF-Tu-like GTPase